MSSCLITSSINLMSHCRIRIRLITCILACCVAGLSELCTEINGSEPANPQNLDPQRLAFFEAKVRPLLIDSCYECHSHESGENAGDLFLDSKDAMLRGGTRGKVLNLDNPIDSLLLHVVGYKDPDLQMPPDGKLAPDSIAILERWIAEGAVDPRIETKKTTEPKRTPIERNPREHWAFNPPLSPRPVRTKADLGSHDRIDTFSNFRAANEGVTIAKPASRDVLIRRLYFDLTGLPPSAKEIEEFVRSNRPDSYQRLVDQLLSSPEYGERFGRHWLDVARYADTIGYATAGKTRRLTGSERFRDWTIRAFAADMPYNEMILHQLAGDRTDPMNNDGNLDAMGFLTVGRRFLNSLDITDDRIDVISRGLLGLTVSCARCHDHKFDPITSEDYYSLFGILRSSQIPKDGKSPLMMIDIDKPRDFHVLVRGQPGNRGNLATRQYLTSLQSAHEKPFSDGSGRHELAARIARSNNPLTARVMVNRIWTHLIGKPLVDSPSDFGFRTEKPKVAEVLEELASDFATHFSIKKTVRRIVTSRIYRQSSDTDAESFRRDPDNRYLSRANRRRRDFESMRDSMLSVSGMLSREIGGAPVEITLPSPTPRRTIYAMIDRQNLPNLFRTFDFASPDTHSPQRYQTTVAQQSLYMMNDPQMSSLAKETARVPNGQHDQAFNQNEIVNWLVRRILSREPTKEESKRFHDFVNQPTTKIDVNANPRRNWRYGTAVLGKQRMVKAFHPFSVFSKGQWQRDKKFPTTEPFGYAMLGKENGHPGEGMRAAVVRRWLVPQAGVLTIHGMVGHRSEKGDGIQADIWCRNERLFSEVQKSNNRPFGPLKCEVKKGDFIDFVADARESTSFDSYFWRIQVKLEGKDGKHYATDSVRDFNGPTDERSMQPLNRYEQLAQVLLMSNEFMFVD